jgi:RND family efflux transporter MFP subunit
MNCNPVLEAPPRQISRSCSHVLGSWLLPTCGGLIVFATLGCNQNSAAGPAKKKPQADIVAEVHRVQRGPWSQTVRSQGELRADEVVAIGTRVAGRVAKVHVELGDKVEAGQPLVSLDPEEFRLLVEQAEAQLAQARSAVGLAPDAPVEGLVPENSPPVRQERAVWDEAKSSFERAKQLRKQNAIAQGEYDLAAVAERVAEARYASALNGVREKLALIGVRQAELQLAKQRLDDAVIKAPFNGFVQQRQVAPGAYLNVGEPIISLVGTDPLWFRGTLPERHAAFLKVGLTMTINVESVSQPIEAKVTRISPALDPQSRSLVFEARIDNPDNALRTGLFAEAALELNPEATAITIPESAVTQFAGAEKVWKVVASMASEQEIITGVSRNGFIEVIDGLEEDDVILTNAAKGRVARVVSPPDPSADKQEEVRVHAMVDDTNVIPEG